MKIRSDGARIIHSPLSFAFSMIEMGGSNIQKYDTISGSYNPNRGITPYVLQPQLMVTDPDGLLVSGDYARQMTVTWTVRLYKDGKLSDTLTAGTDYEVDDETKKLTVNRNVGLKELLSVDFVGRYMNPNSEAVSEFRWHKDLTTEAETSFNINVQLQCPAKLDFSAFKSYGQFPINATVRNGTTELDATKAGGKWQVLDTETKQWTDIVPDDCPWYVSGKDSTRIVVDSEYVQRVALLFTGWLLEDTAQKESASCLLRRWYGVWEDVPEFTYSAYILKETNSAEAQVKIVRRGGNVAEPQKYFDIEMFYRPDTASEWESRGNVTSYTITKDELNGTQQCGDITRELSAFVPVTLPDGSALCDNDGVPLFAQFPTSEKEFE